MSKKVLITGITGMVGSHLADFLLEQTDWDIFGFCRWNDNLENIQHLFPRINAKERVELIYGDLNDLPSLLRAVKKSSPDYVFHLAAQSYPQTSFIAPIETLETNILGTARLLEAIKEIGIKPTIHICASSEVFGRVPKEFLPIDDPPVDPPIDGPGRVKYVIGDVTVYVMAERVQYYGTKGKLITESLKDYTKQIVKKDYSSLDDFLKRWTSAEQKAAIIEELREHGVLLEPLAEEVGKDFDTFDLICHVAFDQPPLTRRERVEKVKKRNYFAKYGDQARKVLEGLLDKYADTGIEHMEDINVLTLSPFSQLGSAVELVSGFGGKSGYIQAVQELERELYA